MNLILIKTNNSDIFNNTGKNGAAVSAGLKDYAETYNEKRCILPGWKPVALNVTKKAPNGRLRLFWMRASTPSSAVRMLGHILDLNLDCVEADMFAGEHKSPEFKKMNPNGTIPVLQDGDLNICESHAMLIYLTTKYGGEKREQLYPSDFSSRALIDHLIFWETGVLFIRLKVAAMEIMGTGLTGPTEKHIADIDEAYSVLEANLKNRLYIAADHLTIADLSLGSTATSIQSIHKLDSNRFPLTAQWIARLNEEECFQKINQNTVIEFSKMLNGAMERNRKQ